MEYDVVEAVGENRDDIVANVFAENIPQFKGRKILENNTGMQTAMSLLRHDGKNKNLPGQTNMDYDDMIIGEGYDALELT